MSINIVIIENNIIAVNTIREKLIRTLMEKGYAVSILTSGKQQEIDTTKEKGFNIIEVGSSTDNPLDIMRYLSKIFIAIKKNKADVCLTFTIRPAIWGNIITRLLNIPTITNITGIGPLFTRNNISYRGARTLYKIALKKTKKVFFQNYDDLNIFINKGLVCPNIAERVPGSGIDYEYYCPHQKIIKDGKFKFIFISRLVKDKGIIEYVDAARILKKEYPDTEFNVLGPVWSQNLKDNTVTNFEIEQWQKEGIINYLGVAEDVRNVIAEADCVVLPSYREGLSNVLLEASSMEKPCVTCNTTGCKEIVEDGITGYLCKIKDPHDLASKMKSMLLLPEDKRIEMGKKARQKVIKEFDKKIVINAYLKAIEQVS